MKKVCTLTFLICITIQAKMPEVLLESIDISNFEVRKKAGNDPRLKRITYFDSESNIYYKIWSPTYYRRSIFEKAINLGFYDENNSSLIALIKDQNGACRGYIAKAGSPIVGKKNKVLFCDIYDPSIMEINKQGDYVIAAFDHQTNELFIEFLSDLREKIIRTGMYYNDFKPRHIIFLDGRFRLIDLESLAIVSNTPKDFLNNPIYPADYKRFVQKNSFKGEKV